MTGDPAPLLPAEGRRAGTPIRTGGVKARSPAVEATTGAPLGSLPHRAPQRRTRPGATSGGGSAGLLPGPPDRADGADEPALWLPIEEVHWDGRPVREDVEAWLARQQAVAAERRRRARPPKPPRSPLAGLAGLVLLTMVAGFFASVSAEPLWLAIGHGDRGVATVDRCTGQGLTLHCRGSFSTPGGQTTGQIRLVGVTAEARADGSRVAARMVDAGSGQAYVEADPAIRHLRWLLGLGVTALCGPAIVWATGAQRLISRRARRGATLAALAGPFLITAGFLVATF